MKYSRLPKKLDKRKNLTEKDKEDIRFAYQQEQPFSTLKEVRRARKLGIKLQSRTDWFKEVAEIYSVSPNRIYWITELVRAINERFTDKWCILRVSK